VRLSDRVAIGVLTSLLNRLSWALCWRRPDGWNGAAGCCLLGWWCTSSWRCVFSAQSYKAVALLLTGDGGKQLALDQVADEVGEPVGVGGGDGDLAEVVRAGVHDAPSAGR